MSKSLRREVVLPFPQEDVWLALTTPEAIAEWLMPNNFKPEVGHEFRLQVDGVWKFSGINECKVLECDPPNRLVYTWVVAPVDPDAPRHEPMTLTWTLSPVEGGTKLVLEQTGLEHLGWFTRFSMAMGWGRYIKRLLPMVLTNIKDGQFQRGAVPRRKRCYGMKRIPDDLVK